MNRQRNDPVIENLERIAKKANPSQSPPSMSRTVSSVMKRSSTLNNLDSYQAYPVEPLLIKPHARRMTVTESQTHNGGPNNAVLATINKSVEGQPMSLNTKKGVPSHQRPIYTNTYTSPVSQAPLAIVPPAAELQTRPEPVRTHQKKRSIHVLHPSASNSSVQSFSDHGPNLYKSDNHVLPVFNSEMEKKASSKVRKNSSSSLRD
jgi:hypothetical protein